MGKIQRLTKSDSENAWVYDIETGGLNVEFGQLISVAAAPLYAKKPNEVTVLRVDQCGDTLGRDKHITKQAVALLNAVEYLIGYNSVGFDAAMLNSFALRNKVAGLCSHIKHADLYLMNKSRWRFGSRSLHSVLTAMHTRIQKFHLRPADWRYALAGDTKAIDRIVKHNVYDVLSLAEFTRQVLRYSDIPWRYIR